MSSMKAILDHLVKYANHCGSKEIFILDHLPLSDGLTYYLDTVRSRAEDRMARYVPDWSTRTFYPRDRGDLEAAIQDFRQKMGITERKGASK